MYAPEKKNDFYTYHYIDESESYDKKTLILSIVSISGDFLKKIITDKLNSLKTDLVSDLRNGLSDKQRSKLFHYCEDSMTIKDKYMAVLRELNIETQIIFKSENEQMSKEAFQNNYYAIFDSLMKNILQRYKNTTNTIIIEENTKIKLTKLENIADERVSFSQKIKIEKSGKNDILLSIPDYILGIVRDCMKEDFSNRLEKLRAWQNLQEDRKFCEISDKIRLVADLTNNEFFSRQNNNKIDCLKLNEYIYSPEPYEILLTKSNFSKFDRGSKT
jgi:hypothetical protein